MEEKKIFRVSEKTFKDLFSKFNIGPKFPYLKTGTILLFEENLHFGFMLSLNSRSYNVITIVNRF